MKKSATLQASIALGAFFLLQGQQSGTAGCSEDPTPTPSTYCQGSVQHISLAPGMTAEVQRCNAQTPGEKYPADQFVAKVDATPSWVAVSNEDYLRVGATMSASAPSVTSLSFEMTSKSDPTKIEVVPVEVTVVDFGVKIEPDTTVRRSPTGLYYAQAGSIFGLQAQVFGPDDEARTYTWTRTGSDEVFTEGSHPTYILDSGIYTFTVEARGDTIGTRTARLDIRVLDRDLGVDLVTVDCNADETAQLDCNRDTTGARAQCVEAVPVWLGDGTPSYTYELSALSSNAELQFGPSRPLKRISRPDRAAFCVFSNEDVTLTAKVTTDSGVSVVESMTY